MSNPQVKTEQERQAMRESQCRSEFERYCTEGDGWDVSELERNSEGRYKHAHREFHFWQTSWYVATAQIDALEERVRLLEGAITKHYPTIAGRVIALEKAGETKAFETWARVAKDLHDVAISPTPMEAVLETGEEGK